MRDKARAFLFKKLPLVALRIIISTLIVSIFFILIQDLLIFPGLYSSFLFNRVSQPSSLVEALDTTSEDGHEVNVWRMKVNKESKKAIAIIFHGNAEHLDNFVYVQTWLKSIGISSYSVEYRGYNGRSSGWPSENGFYLDAEAALKLLLHEEGVSSNEVVVLGSSIGTGTAAFIAQKYNTKALVLLSPYTSLKAVASETPLLGYLAPFIKYSFPSDEYIKKLTHTCVVVGHGKQDRVIPFHHAESLRNLYQGDRSFTLIASERSEHNDLLANEHKAISKALENCLRS